MAYLQHKHFTLRPVPERHRAFIEKLKAQLRETAELVYRPRCLARRKAWGDIRVGFLHTDRDSFQQIRVCICFFPDSREGLMIGWSGHNPVVPEVWHRECTTGHYLGDGLGAPHRSDALTVRLS